MTLSYDWLLDYLPRPLPVAELSRILTSIGLEVEGVDPISGGAAFPEGLMIGEVLTCVPHPNADKLKVTTVSLGDGTEPVQIVCGAPNVAAGEKVVVATVGTTIQPVGGEAFKIKKAKIRGEESSGMLCSASEIGLSADNSGLLLLPAEAPVGLAFANFQPAGKEELAIHVGLTPNRTDAQSHIGTARDVTAYLSHHEGERSEVKLPVSEVNFATGNPPLTVRVEDIEACPRYAGVVIDGIQVGPSPEWLQSRLTTIGVRSINNIVDITNYVLHEFGQPLHAFDADKIRGAEVVVKCLPEGSAFTTLDGVERKLRGEDLMICDADGGICIAGVFGGQVSGITEGTTRVFLESAFFSPSSIRRTSLHHGLRTDAATHFEKGVDVEAVIPALRRAASLILEVAGGKIVSPLIDIYPKPLPVTEIRGSYQSINTLAGKQYAPETVDAILHALGFGLVETGTEGFTVQVPTGKRDVRQVADLAEEVLRIDGLDGVGIPGRVSYALTMPRKSDRELRKRISGLLMGAGFHEILTNSIVNSAWYGDALPLVRMINSLSSELDVMRPSLLESGLEVVSYNINRKASNLMLFEFGSIYRPGSGERPYQEQKRLGLWMTGAVRPLSWQEGERKADIFGTKSVVDALLKACGISTQKKQSDGSVQWFAGAQQVATASAVATDRAKIFSLKEIVYYAEIDWDVFRTAAADAQVKFLEIPRFPSVTRDLALVLDAAVEFQAVQKVTERAAPAELQDFSVFDVYTGEKLGGKKSYALNFIFQSIDRTPTDTEIDSWMRGLQKAYAEKLGAEIRS